MASFFCAHNSFSSCTYNKVGISATKKKWNETKLFFFRVIQRSRIHSGETLKFLYYSIIWYYKSCKLFVVAEKAKLVTLCHSSQHHDKTIFVCTPIYASNGRNWLQVALFQLTIFPWISFLCCCMGIALILWKVRIFF